MLALLNELVECSPEIHWIPSHQSVAQAKDDFEEWYITWNHRADQMAGDANRSRHPDHLQQLQQAQRWHATELKRLRQHLNFYTRVAAHPEKPKEATPVVTQDPDADSAMEPLTDALTLDWPIRLSNCADFPGSIDPCYGRDLLSHLCMAETMDCELKPISLVELLFWFMGDADFMFLLPRGAGFQRQALTLCLTRPTVTELMAGFRRHLHWVTTTLSLTDRLVQNLDRRPLGIHHPTDGIWLFLPPSELEEARGRLCRFTQTRPLRRAADYARPP